LYILGDEELQAIKRVLDSKKLFRYQGPGVETECFLFEKEFASYHKTQHSVVMTSGTNALLTAMVSSGIGPGDEVIVPTYTFFATVAAVVQLGAVPVIVNIDDNLGIDPVECLKKINSKTKAIIAVHMDGLNCNLEALRKICDDKKILLIEDVAQAVGGSYKGKPLGSIGEWGCFSFNQDKIITAGEGGAVITQNKEWYQKAMNAHDTCNQFGLTLKSWYEIQTFIGYSTRVSEITGAMLREQLKRLPHIISTLRSIKNDLIAQVPALQEKLVLASDPAGDCGTSLHLMTQDPLDALSTSKKLIQAGLRVAPMSARPAHCVWQWLHMLKEERTCHPKLNPLADANAQGLYDKAHFASSIDKLSHVIKLEIDINWDAEKIKSVAQSLNN